MSSNFASHKAFRREHEHSYLGRRTCEGPLADAYEELVELRRRLIALQSTADGRRQLGARSVDN